MQGVLGLLQGKLQGTLCCTYRAASAHLVLPHAPVLRYCLGLHRIHFP